MSYEQLSASTGESKGPRMYSGWRKTRGLGLFGLGMTGTFIVIACLIVPLILISINILVALIVLIPCGIVVGFLVTRVDGVPLGNLLAQRLQWWWGGVRGYHSLRSGVVLDHPRAWQLPGVLASTSLLAVEDVAGGNFGLVWDQRSGMMTATLKCTAASTGLADPREAEEWINSWHEWLASLGYLPIVSHVAVTVDTAPEPGSTLADNVYARLDPHAPEDAKTLMQELVWRSPAAAADVDTRVSITFNPARGDASLRSLEEQTAEISRVLHGLEVALSRCGVGVMGRASDHELAGIMRMAFDPVTRGDINRILDGSTGSVNDLLEWGSSGPVSAEESWDKYQHDSGISVSWVWHEAPRQSVPSDVLSRILAPGNYPKRVTLLYRPLSAGGASQILESQVNAAAFRQHWRAKQKRDETARDRADRDLALRAAREEAEGAGLVNVSLYATVTVTSSDDLSAAVSDMEARADQSKIQLRKLYASQSVGFAVTLPAGICPPLLAAGLPGTGK